MSKPETTTITESDPALVTAAIGPRSTQRRFSMNSRYLTNVALSIAGAFTVAASLAFGPAVFQWLMLGAGIVAVASGAGIAIRSRGAAQRGLDGAVTTLGAWTIVASLVFAGSVVTWLGFASGAALVGLALVGLTLHELSTERVVHSIEVNHADDRGFAPING